LHRTIVKIQEQCVYLPHNGILIVSHVCQSWPLGGSIERYIERNSVCPSLPKNESCTVSFIQMGVLRRTWTVAVNSFEV
jgi:hypothetical protein